VIEEDELIKRLWFLLCFCLCCFVFRSSCVVLSLVFLTWPYKFQPWKIVRVSFYFDFKNKFFC